MVIIAAPPLAPPVNETNQEASISRASFYYPGTNETEQEARERYMPVVDIASPDFKPIETIFKVM